MKRRTLLKGAAATGALGVMGVRRPQKSAAARRVRLIQQELPSYELVSFYVTDELIFANGQNWRGTARDINNEGTILGDIGLGGIMIPVSWDSALTMNTIDAGDYSGMSINMHVLDDVGTMIGYGLDPTEFITDEEAQSAQLDVPTIVWRDGLVDTSLSGPWGLGNGVTSVTNDGVLLGTLDTSPTFWKDDQPEALAMPAGFVTGGYRAANSRGDYAGSLYSSESPFGGGVPFIRSAAGEITILEPPMGNAADWLGRVQSFSLSDDGSVAALVRGETDTFGTAVRYANGTQTPIADLSGEGLYFTGANAQGTLVGQALYNGISIPTIWIDDQPVMIADLIVPGPDLILLEVNAINDAGTIVGSAQDSAGSFHHVVLRQV